MVNWDLAKSYLKDIRKFPEFCAKYLVIQPEQGGKLIPFKLNAVQKFVHENFVVPKYLVNKPVRLVVLKGRQHGISTYAEALAFWQTVGHERWNSLVIGEDVDQTKTIFRMVKRFNDNCPWMQDPPDTNIFPIFPQIRDSQDTLEFNHPSKAHKRHKVYTTRDDVIFLDSRIEVKSAEKKDSLGRAGFYQTVHASEAARWPTLAASLGSLLACCHDKPQTVVIVECTANGFNEFYSFWTNLKIGAIEVPSLWQKVFLPWYLKPSLELKVKKAPREYEGDYEAALFKRIMSDPILRTIDPSVDEDRVWNKLFWRRQTLRDKYFGDEGYFKQEFPSTDAEAFLFSGTSVYTEGAISRLEAEVCEPEWTGNIHLNRKEGESLDISPSLLTMEPHDRGKLKIWKQPEIGHKYCVFADVAEGKAMEGVSEAKSKYDFSCAQIVKVTSWPPAMEQVAVWHGNCDPDEFGTILVALARMYMNAYLGWEINGPGRSIALQVVNLLKYPNVYMREDYDHITKRQTWKVGWRTTARTKPDMVAVSQRFVRQAELIIHDAGTLGEMKSFARLDANKYGAAQGHDDRVIALCGLCAIIEPMVAILKRQSEAELKEVEMKKHDRDRDGDWEPMEEPWNPILGEEF